MPENEARAPGRKRVAPAPATRRRTQPVETVGERPLARQTHAVGGIAKKSLRPARRRELAEWFQATFQVRCSDQRKPKKLHQPEEPVFRTACSAQIFGCRCVGRALLPGADSTDPWLPVWRPAGSREFPWVSSTDGPSAAAATALAVDAR